MWDSNLQGRRAFLIGAAATVASFSVAASDASSQTKQPETRVLDNPNIGKRTTRRISEKRFQCEDCFHKQSSAAMTEQSTGKKTGWQNMPSGDVDIP